jgi:hypothetical protein
MSGYQKSEKSNPALAEFFRAKFEEYWPDSPHQGNPSQPFSFEEEMALAFPLTPSAWQEAATLADLAFRDLTPPQMKAAVETLETSYLFDLILVALEPKQK